MKIDPHVSLAGPTLTAVEMGGDWFKLVQVSRTKAGSQVTQLALKRMEEIEGMRGPGLLHACGVSGRIGAVLACLPRQMVNVRLFDLPSGDPREIADMIDLQIARQTPYSREEIVYDYRVVDSERPGYTRIMLVIAQSSHVRQRVRAIEEAGFEVEAVAVSTDGWLAMLQEGGAEGDGLMAYLDMDSSHGDFLILQKGAPLFSRSIPVGARDLAGNREGQEERLAQELSRALETFRNENAAGVVERVEVSGVAARLAGLPERLQTWMKIPVSAAGGLGAANLPDHPALQMASVTGLLGATVGSARLQVNLIPETVSLRKAVAVKARRMTLAAILLMAALGLMSLWVESRLQRREAYLAQLDHMIRETREPAESVDAMRRKVDLVAARLDSKMLPAKILAGIHDAAGERIVFTSLEIAGAGKVVCRGVAEGGADVGGLVSALEASPLLKNVQTMRTSKNKEGLMEFEIGCDTERRKP
jgi:hypothetical protein